MSRKYKTRSFRLCRCCYKWRCQCLIPRKKKPHPPFNSGTKLDNKLGLHPKLNALASISAAVSFYDPQPVDCKSGAINWKNQQETEEFATTMGGRLTEKIMFQKNLIKIGRGPGAHEITRWPESILEASCKSFRMDVSFGTVSQFQPSYKSTTPGPGYTLRTHNPYYYLEQKKLKGFSHVPSFEFDGLAPRFREVRRSWSLPCTRYSVKHPNSLQVFLEKVTGKRGPYDLFTGPRDESTIKGYSSRKRTEDYNDWPRKIFGEIEKLQSKCNYYKGKWSTNTRFTKKPVTRMMLQDISTCYKNPDEPGPGHYNPCSLQKSSSIKRYPFDSTVARFHCMLLSSDTCSEPGRYKIKENYRTKGHGWTCVFKSKVPRTIGAVIPSSYSDF